MKLFDTHSHIDDSCFNKDFSQMIARADQENIKGIMVVGIDIKTSKKAIEIAKGNKNTITSVGLHPHYAGTFSSDLLQKLKKLALENKCVKAWGETGLDFNRMHSPAKLQESCFIEQLNAAGELDLPLIFHERDSEGRFYELLKEHGPEQRHGVVHCFSGSKQEMFKYLDLGYYIGITGILTIQKRGEYLRKIAPLIPDDRLVIETDAPYLTPAPQKNKSRRNEPGFVKSVMLKLAEIKSTDPEKLAQILWENSLKLYRLNEF